MDNIRGLFDSQSLAVLATQKNNQPYASMVLFAATPDLKADSQTTALVCITVDLYVMVNQFQNVVEIQVVS